MANLHGLLAELGLANPEMHPERDPEQYTAHETEWVVDRAFTPEPGSSYELAYGLVSLHGRDVHARVRIRADGASPSQWFDLDEGRPLEPELQARPVRAYRPISDSSAAPSSH